MAECLITGCRLVLPTERKHVWGDLHRVGQAGIFNACLGKNGEAAWVYEEAPNDGRLSVALSPLASAAYFERRGVIVFDLLHMRLSEETKAYLAKWGRDNSLRETG